MAVAIIGTSTTEHTLSDSNAIDAGAVGFIAYETGTFEGRARGDAADRTFPTVAGNFYPIEMALAKLTDASVVTKILVVYGTYR